MTDFLMTWRLHARNTGLLLLSTEEKGLTSWLLFVMFIMILLLSHLVSWDSSGT